MIAMSKPSDAMKLLEKHFDTAFAAPNGIKKLRELILTLAMQGKLVPQDPNDQTARELLKEIAAEKKRLVKERKIKEPKPLPEIKPEEVPCELPKGWEWVRLGTCMLKITDGTHHSPPNSENGDFLYISAKNIKDDGVLLENATYVTKSIHEEIFARCDPEYGDILYIKDGATTGIVTINNLREPFSMLSSVALLKPPKLIFNKFLFFAMKSPLFYSEMRAEMTGVAITRVTLQKMQNAIIPLPPLTEQRRIVAKIDQLMVRCDELEKLRAEHGQKRIAAHTAALNRLLGATEGKTFNATWDFITQNFSELYSVKENVTELRKAILQLAVMGKLVPQDPNDQTAKELLKEIAAEKKRLVKAGKIKAPKPLPDIKPEEVPYDLPKGWEWVRISSVFNTTSGTTFDAALERDRGTFAYVKVGDMNLLGNEQIITMSSRYIDPDKKMMRALIPTGSIIFPKRGGAIATNKKRIVQDPVFVDLNTMAITPMNGVTTEYAYQWLLTIDLATLNTGTSVPQINHKDIDPLPFPLPPLHEQHRIVAMIDQLIALCDELGKHIDAATGKQSTLLNAVIAQV